MYFAPLRNVSFLSKMSLEVPLERCTVFGSFGVGARTGLTPPDEVPVHGLGTLLNIFSRFVYTPGQ